MLDELALRRIEEAVKELIGVDLIRGTIGWEATLAQALEAGVTHKKDLELVRLAANILKVSP